MADLGSIPKNFLLGGISFYRWVISPLLGNCCRFYPSCSLFAIHAIEKHGLLYGGWLTVKRLLKCHPWHRGGIDEVP